MFCRSLFVLLSPFVWPLYCMSFNLQLLCILFFIPNTQNLKSYISYLVSSWVWVSGWLLFKVPHEQFPATSWQEVKFQWDYDEIRFVLDQNALSWNFIVLAHWNYSLRIDMSPHTDTSRFRTNPSLLSLLITACPVQKQQILIL